MGPKSCGLQRQARPRGEVGLYILSTVSACARPPAGLAIALYAGESGCYLLYCDASWSTLTDTWHESPNHAKQQAAFEAGQPLEWVAFTT